MPADFHTRLRRCLRVGDLTVADAQRWFARPYHTVRMWVKDNGREPRGPAGKLAFERLALLEQGIRTERDFPVPRTLSAIERPKYIEQVRDGLERARVPESGVA